MMSNPIAVLIVMTAALLIGSGNAHAEDIARLKQDLRRLEHQYSNEKNQLIKVCQAKKSRGKHESQDAYSNREQYCKQKKKRLHIFSRELHTIRQQLSTTTVRILQ